MCHKCNSDVGCPECCGQKAPEPKRQPHKHAALIKAWADGAEIEYLLREYPDHWAPVPHAPNWNVETVYRIKPVPKPDVVSYACVRGTEKWRRPDIYITSSTNWNEAEKTCFTSRANVKFVFDGETGELKSISMLA